jgi:tRNA pseudouridine55 synthase
VEFDVHCSKGAYIRVLAEDLAKALGTVAHLTALRRLSVAPFGEGRLWGFEALEALSLSARRALLLPVDAALESAPRYDLSASQVTALRQGKTLEVPAGAPGTVRIYSEELGFLGLGALEMPGRLVPLRLISADVNRA